MIETDRVGRVLHVWLSRPECHNALDDGTLSELAEIYSSAQTRFDVDVIVLGGRGRSFSAGADRKAPPGQSGSSERERRWNAQVGYRACQAIADCEAVTLARLHGNVIGGGLAIALACDFRIAADTTRFSLPEVDLGLPLTWGTVPRLISEVGASRARELTLLCEQISAEDALRIGLVHRSVPSDCLDPTVDEFAARILTKPEYAVHVTKTQFRTYSRPSGDPTYSDGDLFNVGMCTSNARANFSH